MLKSEDKTIGKYTYRVTMLPATKAIEVNHFIASAVGPAFAEVVGSTDGDMKAEVKLDSLGRACQLFFKAAKPDDLIRIAKMFAAKSLYNTEDKEPGIVLGDRFDEHFAGDMPQLIKWFTFCVKVNFGNFTELSGLLANLG